MEITFTKGNWEHFFDYAYTWRFPDTPKFIQEENCIANTKGEDGYGFTSIFLKQKYGRGTKISFTASFESYGAPLLVIAKDLDRDSDGNLRFGDYQEIVLWENGVNVWNFQKVGEAAQIDGPRYRGFPLVESGVRIDWLLRNDFPLEAKKLHTLTVELCWQRLKVWADDRYFELQIPDLPEKAWLGITGCEGLNRFYNLTLEPGVPER